MFVTGLHYRACNLCEAICGLAITVEGGRITDIRGDGDDPLSRGHICPKAVALKDVWRDPDRLRHPVRRSGRSWVRVGWEDAVAEVADRITDIQRQHGADAVAYYQGNPTVHSSGTMLTAPAFFRTLHTHNRFSASTVDQQPHHVAARFMFGHRMLLPVPDIDRTDFFLVIGANPMVSNGSMMTAPGMAARIRALRRRGGRMVVIDPRRTETARAADRHHFITPGTDAWLLLAVLHTIFAEDLIDLGSVNGFTDGLDRLRRAVVRFPPERTAPVTGIDAGLIRRLAIEFATAPSAVCYGRIGVSTQESGSVNQWLVSALNIVTGNLDRAGGAMFTTPAIDLLRRATEAERGSHGRWSSRVRGAPEFSGELPAAVMAEEILTVGPGRIRALVTSAGNPVLSTPNGGRLEHALGQLEFMVSIDPYVNETTRHADIILPPACALESDHYDLVFHTLAVRNTARYSPAVVPPEPGTRYDWQIFRELTRKMEAGRPGRGGPLTRLRRWVRGRLGPAAMIDLALRRGPYGVWGGRRLTGRRLSLRRLRRAPHGVDLGPLQPCLPGRLRQVQGQGQGRGRRPGRGRGRIDLAPGILVADLDRLRFERPAGGMSNGTRRADEFLLIGRRDLRSKNSWMHNAARLMKGPDRCTMLMNPHDARLLRLEHGASVTVSAVGAPRTHAAPGIIPVALTTDIMPGVVSIPHGWGHHRPGIELRVAARHPGLSINDLTDDEAIDPLSGTAAFSGVVVRVRPSRTTKQPPEIRSPDESEPDPTPPAQEPEDARPQAQ